MRNKPQIIFAFVIMAVFVFATLSALSFPVDVRIYAWVSSIGGGAMCASYLAVQLLGKRKQKSSDEGEAEAEPPAKVSSSRLVMWFSAIGALTLTTWLFGYGIAALLFVFGYIKLNGKSWLMTIGVTALVFLLLWGFLDRILMVNWVQGVVPRWLGME